MMARQILLDCGIFAMLWYVAINIVVPIHYPGYDIASYTISELSAIDAPTRVQWARLCVLYSILFFAFGLGVWLSANDDRRLRIVAAVIMIDSVIGFFWPPMHRREVIASGGGSLTDTLHLVWAFAHLVLMLAMIGFGAATGTRWFRVFSGLIVLVFIVFGILTTRESRWMEAGLPTPHIGVWERINIAAYMVWVIAFAVMLLWRNATAKSRSPARYLA